LGRTSNEPGMDGERLPFGIGRMHRLLPVTRTVWTGRASALMCGANTGNPVRGAVLLVAQWIGAVGRLRSLVGCRPALCAAVAISRPFRQQMSLRPMSRPRIGDIAAGVVFGGRHASLAEQGAVAPQPLALVGGAHLARDRASNFRNGPRIRRDSRSSRRLLRAVVVCCGSTGGP
jgi:hypothetical protein